MAQIDLEAKPHPITLETKKAALIVVDMQNDFGSKGGLFDHGGVDISCIQKVVPAIARAIAVAREAGMKVIGRLDLPLAPTHGAGEPCR